MNLKEAKGKRKQIVDSLKKKKTLKKLKKKPVELIVNRRDIMQEEVTTTKMETMRQEAITMKEETMKTEVVTKKEETMTAEEATMKEEIMKEDDFVISTTTEEMAVIKDSRVYSSMKRLLNAILDRNADLWHSLAGVISSMDPSLF